MRPTLKAPGSKRLILQHHELRSKFAVNVNLRRYAEEEQEEIYGRDDEIAEIEAAVVRLRAGGGGAGAGAAAAGGGAGGVAAGGGSYLIEGEPGAGKSSLMRRAKWICKTAGVKYVSVYGQSFSVNSPFFAADQLVAKLTRELGGIEAMLHKAGRCRCRLTPVESCVESAWFQLMKL